MTSPPSWTAAHKRIIDAQVAKRQREGKGTLSLAGIRERVHQPFFDTLTRGISASSLMNTAPLFAARGDDAVRGIGKSTVGAEVALHQFSVTVARAPFRPGRAVKGRFKLGAWGQCAYCLHDTRALLAEADVHAHMACDATAAGAHIRDEADARELLNRHERRRRGIPRPPISEERARLIAQERRWAEDEFNVGERQTP